MQSGPDINEVLHVQCVTTKLGLGTRDSDTPGAVSALPKQAAVLPPVPVTSRHLPRTKTVMLQSPMMMACASASACAAATATPLASSIERSPAHLPSYRGLGWPVSGSLTANPIKSAHPALGILSASQHVETGRSLTHIFVTIVAIASMEFMTISGIEALLRNLALRTCCTRLRDAVRLGALYE